MKNTIILAVAALFLVNTYMSQDNNKNASESKTSELLKSESLTTSTTGRVELNTDHKPKLSRRFISGNTLVITYKGVTEDDFMITAVKQEISVKARSQNSKIILPKAKNQIVEHIH